MTTTVNPEVAKADIRIELVHWNSLYEHGQFKAVCPVDGCGQEFVVSDQENDRAIRKQVETHIHAVHEVSREEIVELLKAIKSAVETIAVRLADLEERVDGIKTVPIRGGFRIEVPHTLASLKRAGRVTDISLSERRWMTKDDKQCHHWDCEVEAIYAAGGTYVCGDLQHILYVLEEDD